jgi:hypothetical protein
MREVSIVVIPIAAGLLLVALGRRRDRYDRRRQAEEGEERAYWAAVERAGQEERDRWKRP